MTTTMVRPTVASYLALREGEKPYREFVFGEIREKAMPNQPHADSVQVFAEAFGRYRQTAGGRSGPEGRVRFATIRGEEFRLPDYAYWAPGKPRSDGQYLLPPTLAVEVRSPDESMNHQRDKCRYYREHGIDVCWLVDPKFRVVEVFEGARDAEPVERTGMLRSVHLPGFELALADLWAAIAP